MAQKTMNRTLTPVFALWKKTDKNGKPYFSGKTEDGTYLTGFLNGTKKNPKEPDLRVYVQDSDHNLSKEPLVSMWCNVSESTKKKYLTGKIGDKRVVGFINDKGEGNRPYVSVYYSEDTATEKAPEQTKIEDVPFTL